MKATMSENGVITISPESDLEAYALGRWSLEAVVMREDIERMEQCHVRGSRLVVQTYMLKPLPGNEASCIVGD